jgi:hypothetical protein
MTLFVKYAEAYSKVCRERRVTNRHVLCILYTMKYALVFDDRYEFTEKFKPRRKHTLPSAK